MNDLSSMSPQEIKAAEKQLYEEYKQKVAQLKKVQQSILVNQIVLFFVILGVWMRGYSQEQG